MRALVIGAGIAGLATARSLALGGHQVALIEQGPLPNPLAASHDQHRLIRHVYGDAEGYCRMVDEAFAAWERLWRGLGERLYVETGALALSTDPEDWSQRSAHTLDRIGHPWSRIDAAELRGRFPVLNPPEGSWAVWTKAGGVLLAERILAALARDLGRCGVEIHAGIPAVAADPRGARITLANGTRLEADRLVIAAGAWTPKLLPRLATQLQPYRQAVAYVRPPAALAGHWEGMPILVDLGGPDDLYVVPPVAGTGLKFGAGSHRRRGDPDDPRAWDANEAQAILARFSGRLAQLNEHAVERLQVCYYTFTQDRRFLIEAIGPTLVVSACSGHGFKFGALIGERIAESLASGADPQPLIRWAAGF